MDDSDENDDAAHDDEGGESGNGDHPENRGRTPGDPLQGSYQISHHTARLPESIGSGVFANALMVLSGQLEVILDFVQRLHEPNRVVARVVLSPVVAQQFAATLRQNIERFEETFGELPKLPQPVVTQEPTGDVQDAAPTPPSPGDLSAIPPAGGIVGAGISEPGTPKPPPGIEEIYDDLRLDDEMLYGRYANAVVVRHSPAEFAFDFVTRFVPKSAVSSRVIVAAPNVANMLHSLEASINTRPPQ